MYNDIDKIFEVMREAVHNGPVAIKELKEAGRPVIGTYCTFTPWELINAAGGISVSLCSTSDKPIAAAEKHLPRNLCPLIKSSYGFALTDTCPYFHFCDMVVGETTCDGKKKMYELLGKLRPTHVMQLPQRAGHPKSLELWKHEITALKEELEKLCGTRITDEKLAASISLRNAMHAAAMRFYDLSKLPDAVITGKEIMLVSDYLKFTFDYEKSIAKVNELVDKILENYIDGQRRQDIAAHRILITGCPMGKSLEKIVDVLESPDCASIVVGFENCGNLKCSHFRVSEEIAPLDALAEKYLSIPCSVMSPNTGRLELLRHYAEKYRADGVVDVILQACHTYNVESYSVRQFLADDGVPYIAVETDYSQGDLGQLATRFGAFTEML
ncbi:double-cubane-cluster-containing anaerobic reductase [Cloacibacillus evryensis]|uniref:double-cubane-cluster-containing anaerobic reductase n=1 Tax=Cloacibacillus evryensis TaxID=508460 RepID=UPI003A8AA58D